MVLRYFRFHQTKPSVHYHAVCYSATCRCDSCRIKNRQILPSPLLAFSTFLAHPSSSPRTRTRTRTRTRSCLRPRPPRLTHPLLPFAPRHGPKFIRHRGWISERRGIQEGVWGTWKGRVGVGLQGYT
eukprot:753336-Hanusia_phi.AAC.2